MHDQQLALELKTGYIEMACERVGGLALSCSDDFFAEMHNLLQPGRGVFIEDKYTDRGKWMDGWESRRSYGRDNGREFDWCIIKLGIAGQIAGVDVDTNHFRGNAPQAVSIEACYCEQPDDNTQWQTILERDEVQAHSQNLFRIENEQSWTHLRLNIFPDGGVARLRVYGKAEVNWASFPKDELVDLAYIKHGGRSLLVSDMFFSDKNNLLMPGRGVNMGDGWETKRRRDPGPDWNIISLGHAGYIKKILLDTCHFKGNFPDSFTLEACLADSQQVLEDRAEWQTILTRQKLTADAEHIFQPELLATDMMFNHIRLNIFPDGGVSRLRVFALLAGGL